MADRPYTVSEITQAVKQTLEEFPNVWVTGELSGFTQASSGHRYFTLIDPSSQLKCVMWKSRNLTGFKPEPGLDVLAQGTLTVYERRGEYQFNVNQLFPAGAGKQQLALEQLKRRLAEEGLFSEESKRPLPESPEIIGVVTSRTGAAVRDVLNVLGRRAPWVRVVLRPAVVQGPQASADIAQGIEELNQWGRADLLIVGRGGGSAEDLAAFNTEQVVRAIRNSRAPVISAVGHEIDISLADLAADCRAPTPSAAAELAVRDAKEYRGRVSDLTKRVRNAMDDMLKEKAGLLNTYLDSYVLRRLEDRVFQQMQHVDELQKDLFHGIRQEFELRSSAYGRLTGQLSSLSPLSVLNRGYSVALGEDGQVVRDAGTLSEGDQLQVRFSEGRANCRVDEIYPD